MLERLALPEQRAEEVRDLKRLFVWTGFREELLLRQSAVPAPATKNERLVMVDNLRKTAETMDPDSLAAVRRCTAP